MGEYVSCCWPGNQDRKASSSGLKACKSSPSEAGALSEDTLGGSSGSGGVGSRTSTLPGELLALRWKGFLEGASCP